jgi:hypothetical protein
MLVRPVRDRAASAIRVPGSSTETGVDDLTVVAIAGPDARHASVTTSMAVTNSGLAAIHD